MIDGMGHDLPRVLWPQLIDAIAEQRPRGAGRGVREQATHPCRPAPSSARACRDRFPPALPQPPLWSPAVARASPLTGVRRPRGAPAAVRLHAHQPVEVVAAVGAAVGPAAVQRSQHPLLVADGHPHARPLCGHASCSTSSHPQALPSSLQLTPRRHLRSAGRSARHRHINQRFHPRLSTAAADALKRCSAAREVIAVRPAGIEPAACGLKDRCSLAPRREPLTTELRARAVVSRLLRAAAYSKQPALHAPTAAGSAATPRSRRPFDDRSRGSADARDADPVAELDAGHVDRAGSRAVAGSSRSGSPAHAARR